MDGVRVAWKELKVAFGVFVRWVSRDLVGEPAASAQGIDVVGKLFDFLPEESQLASIVLIAEQVPRLVAASSLRGHVDPRYGSSSALGERALRRAHPAGASSCWSHHARAPG